MLRGVSKYMLVFLWKAEGDIKKVATFCEIGQANEFMCAGFIETLLSIESVVFSIAA